MVDNESVSIQTALTDIQKANNITEVMAGKMPSSYSWETIAVHISQ